MERENLMQRFTSSVKSFLVPSFVSNVLSPRRDESHAAASGQRETAVPNRASRQQHSQQQQQHSQQQQQHEEPIASRTIDIASVDRPNSSGAAGSSSVLWTSVDRGKRHHEGLGGVSLASGSKRLKVSPSSRQSMFYPGRVAYGGSYNSQQHQQQQSVRVTPLMWDQKRVQRSQREPLTGASSVGDNRLVTPTAKKILDALDRLSTPLSDARRMPPAPESSVQQQARSVHYSPYRVAYRRRQAQVPNRSMGVVRQQEQQRSRVADSPSALAAAPSLTGGLVSNLSGVSTAATTPLQRHRQSTTTEPPEAPATPQFEFSAPIQRGPRRHSPATAPSPFTFSRPQAAAPLAKPLSAPLGAEDSSFVPKLKTTNANEPQLSSGSFKDALKSMKAAGKEKERASADTRPSAPSASSTPTISVPATTSKATVESDSEEWRCDTCSCVSPASAQACIVCQTKRPSTSNSSTASNSATTKQTAPASLAAPAPAGGDKEWRCDTCSCVSPASSQVCVVCQTKRPSGTQSSVESATETQEAATAMTLPKRPSFLDNGPATTPIFSMFSQQKGQPDAEATPSASAKWQCSTCLVENVAAVSRCVCCDSAKPGALPKAPTASDSAPKPTFSFSGSADSSASKVSFGAPSSAGGAPLPKINFGAPATTSESSKPEEAGPKATFGFGKDSASAGSTGSFKFGAPSSSDSGQPGLSGFKFGASSGAEASSGKSSSFGAAASSGGADDRQWRCDSCSCMSPASAQACVVCQAKRSSPSTQTSLSNSESSMPKLAFGAPAATTGSASSGPKVGFGAPSAAASSISSAPKSSFGDTTSVSLGPPAAKISFGAPTSVGSESSAPKLSFGAPTSSSESSAPKLSFGAPTSSESSAPKLSFGAPTSSSDLSAPKLSFGAPTSSESSAPKLGFGAPASTEAAAPKLSFGAPSTATSVAPSLSFGAAKPAISSSESSMPKLTFGAPTSAASNSSAPKLSFGAAPAVNAEAAGAKGFGAPASSAPTMSFGAPAGSNSTVPKLDFGAPAASSSASLAPTMNFGAPNSTAPKSLFGAAASTESQAQPPSNFSFGGPAPSTFTFGGAPSGGQSATVGSAAPSLFGGSSATSAPDFSFGGSQLKRPADQQQQAPQSKLPSSGSGLFGGQSAFGMANNNAFGTGSLDKPQAPQVDLDASKQSASFNFGGDQASNATFVFGSSRPQQQQQPALNGSSGAPNANPFTPAPAVGSRSSSRPRVMGRRRLAR